MVGQNISTRTPIHGNRYVDAGTSTSPRYTRYAHHQWRVIQQHGLLL